MKLPVLFCAILLLTTIAQTMAQKDSFSSLFNAIKSEPDPSKMETLIKQMEEIGADDRNNSMLLNYSRQYTALAFAEKGELEKAIYWVSRIDDAAMRDGIILNIAGILTDKNKLAEAEKLIMPVWERLKVSPGTSSSGVMGAQSVSAADFASQYGLILYRKGEFKKAISYLVPSEAGGRSRNRNGEIYAMALVKAGESEKAFDEIRKLLLSPGHRSSEFNDIAQKAFVKKFGNADRYTQIIDSLAIAEQQKMDAKVAKMMVNEPAPDFVLTDLDGKKVSLKSLKGKTVILDFWATWCQPCVASFPGMQKAVDYYKSDTSVVFMFIHTAEKSEDPVGDVKNFMGYKKYRFDVYMDLKDKITGRSPVMTDFKVRGIPAKFLIDTNGIIRFKNSGYVSEDEAIPEIKTMVEMVKKNY